MIKSINVDKGKIKDKTAIKETNLLKNFFTDHEGFQLLGLYIMIA